MWCKSCLRKVHKNTAFLSVAITFCTTKTSYAGSNPVGRTKSSQASYRLRRFFMLRNKIISRSFYCSSRSPRKRYAGLQDDFLERRKISKLSESYTKRHLRMQVSFIILKRIDNTLLEPLSENERTQPARLIQKLPEKKTEGEQNG